jgi:long-chain fatty acid transport protein
LLANGSVNLAIKMPDTLSGSIFHKLNDKWDIMADATLTGWSVFDQLKVVRASGTTMSLTQENWKNTWRVAAGATHHYSDQWLARVGVAYDQSPVPDAFRTARIPDNDRTWLSLGGQYKPAKVSAVDFGYSHLFVSDASLSNNKGGVDNPSTAAYGNLVGSYQNSVDILSVQYTHSF